MDALLVFFFTFAVTLVRFKTLGWVATINAELLLVALDKAIQIDQINFELPRSQPSPKTHFLLLAMVD